VEALRKVGRAIPVQVAIDPEAGIAVAFLMVGSAAATALIVPLRHDRAGGVSRVGQVHAEQQPSGAADDDERVRRRLGGP
jgi:hypothetical protein